MTRRDETLYPAELFGLDNEFRFAYTVGDEPLRIYESDSKKLTVVYSFRGGLDCTKQRFDVSLSSNVDRGCAGESDSEWSLARYLDGRPAGGVLVSNGMCWRYETSSMRRGKEPIKSPVFFCAVIIWKYRFRLTLMLI